MDFKAAVPDWAWGMNCAVTVCDAECNIIYMNARSRETFAGHGDLIGHNLLDYHNERSIGIIRHLLDTGSQNCYTIEKAGVRKMIFQTAWRNGDGTVGGLVELSMILPDDVPHYVRE